MNGVLGHFYALSRAELGRGQPGLMRWIWDETLPQSSIDRSTFYSAAHRATKWASGRPHFAQTDVETWIQMAWLFWTPGLAGQEGKLLTALV